MTTDARDLRENDDDGFHEIQLSGKQLVFLCMATTVVSIVIFLCGVLVGRGVRPVEAVAEAAAVVRRPTLLPDAPAPADAPAAGAAAPAAAANEPTPTPDVPPTDEPAAAAAPASAPPAQLPRPRLRPAARLERAPEHAAARARRR